MVLVNSQRASTLSRYGPRIPTSELLYLHARIRRIAGNHSARAVTNAVSPQYRTPNHSADHDRLATSGVAGCTS